MVKKEDTFSFVKDIFSNLILSNIADFVKNTIHHIQESIYRTTRKVIESFIAMFLLLAGMAMILISLPFLLSYYLNLPASLFFILIGIILILIALFSFDKINRTKFKD